MKPRFTLWELCVLVSTALSLAILLVPAMYGGFDRGHGRAICKSNQRQITVGLLQFKDDHDYRFPSEADFKGGNPFWVGGGIADMPGTLDPARPLASYIRDAEIFECPRDMGTSAFDHPKHCYTAWGSSYLLGQGHPGSGHHRLAGPQVHRPPLVRLQPQDHDL